ncbi:MAG: polysaccharide deacetylase family protein [Streptosporangiaceae bacterium]
MLSPVPVLLYHSISTNPPAWIAPFAVTPATFAAHLDAVVASGRQPLTVSQYVDGLRGASELPDRSVLITADDGFADFVENALPALMARTLPSTLYVATGSLADTDRETVLPGAPMLRGADLPGLEAAGVEIGAHSHTHRHLDLLPDREVSAELARSREILSKALGHPVRSFAFPHGYWKPGLLAQVAAAGHDSAAGVGNALSTARDHPLALSRLMVRADTPLSTIVRWLDGEGRSSPRHRAAALGWRRYRHLKQLTQRKSWLG